MKKAVSLRDMIILGVLIIIAAYYYLVQVPITKETEALESTKAEVESEIDLAQTQVMVMNSMEKEVEEIVAESNGDPWSLPDYNNTNNVINELNTILASTISYNIAFGDEVQGDYVVRKEIKITYKVNSYRAAISKINAIRTSNYGYIIEDISISEESSRVVVEEEEMIEYEYTISLTMVGIDYKPVEAQTVATTETESEAA